MDNFLQKLKGSLKSKTMLWNLLIMGLGVAETVIPETSIPWLTQSILLLVLGTSGLFLRWITNTGLEEK